MIIVEPSATLLHMTDDPLGVIERAGRTCYKSEEKITADSKYKFAQMLLNRKHESVLEHATATILLITDRGVTHELVRHRIASYSQESTRYCNYAGSGIAVINPPGFDPDEQRAWVEACEVAEYKYNYLIGRGVKPQIARSVLPTCLKTEIVTTANLREWRYILRLRLAPAAHPQMVQLMWMVKKVFDTSEAAPLFGDI